VEKFLRGRMHGEGNTMRHLASLGFRVAYEQDPRTEFDFAVANLGVDLRSGVRLLRVTELLTGALKTSSRLLSSILWDMSLHATGPLAVLLMGQAGNFSIAKRLVHCCTLHAPMRA
jgi:hypothetical protein